jgi:hypothetical protein
VVLPDGLRVALASVETDRVDHNAESGLAGWPSRTPFEKPF